MADVDAFTPGRIAAAFGELTVHAGVRQDPGAAAWELLQLAEEPLREVGPHPGRRSALTDSGVPLELSMRVDEHGEPSVRLVVDTADHRYGIAGNRDRYLAKAAVVAGCATADQVAALRRLCQVHLEGAPPGLQARVMHGIGYGRHNRRRGSLYFPTGWLPPAQLERRVPQLMAVVAEAERRQRCSLPAGVEVVGYDFAAGEVVRWKTYKWLPVRQDLPFEALAGHHPDLVPAREVVDTFSSAVPPRARDQALFLQLAWDRSSLREKLFFFCSAWGWGTADGLAGVLGFLHRTFDLDLRMLLAFREVMARHELPFKLAMIALGGDQRRPSATFYFWPASGGPGRSR